MFRYQSDLGEVFDRMALLDGGDGSARFAMNWRRDNPGCDEARCGDPACRNLGHMSKGCIAAVKEYRRLKRIELVKARGY